MILLPHAPKIIEKKGHWARFEIDSLYPGYGMTIGNSLRRVLLSSLPGAAVTQVKIRGVQHEFSTIPGVLEDVIVIMMNLKQMRFKLYGDEPQKATLKMKGEREIKGSDFEFPSQVELVNQDCHIATLTEKKAELEMEIQVERGFGYETVEHRKKEGKLEIGVLPVDSIFTPMKRVSFKVENMRVGERTDFDRLTLDIETDGTIAPQEAFFGAAQTLVQHFVLLTETFQKETVQPKERGKEKKSEGAEEDMKLPLEETKLSTRTLNLLLENNIKTVGGLARKSQKTLLEIEGMGDKGIKEINKILKKFEIPLKEE